MKNIIAYLLLAALTAGLCAGCAADKKPKNGLYKNLIVASELEGFGDPVKIELYTNNVLVEDGTFDELRDNKKLYYSDTAMRVVDYPNAMYFTLPLGLEADLSMSGVVTRYSSDELVVVSSRESGSCKRNLDHDQRFIRDERYREANDIINYREETLTVNGIVVDVLSMQLDRIAEDKLSVFTHVNFYKGANNYYHYFLIKHVAGYEFDLDAFVNGFGYIPVQGGCVRTIDFLFTVPEIWSETTRAYYDKLCNQHNVDWGVYPSHVDSTGLRRTMPQFEEEIGEPFDIIMRYWHHHDPFRMSPTWLEAIKERGYDFMCTYQFTTTNNSELWGYNINLDIYRGEQDGAFRKFAQSVRDYGNPVMFRLNNEMNTDWTTYSGCATLGDPEIFAENWRRMYDIFVEEGVDNAIWVFNTQDKSWPDRNWNHWFRFWPGVDYVELIGLTAYNGGHNTWDSFDRLYAPLRDKLNEYFLDWPWVIGEFGCNNLFGDRPQWIRDMFSVLHEYPNLKAAVWFSANDYASDGSVYNEYTLKRGADMEAWKEGLAASRTKVQELYGEAR